MSTALAVGLPATLAAGLCYGCAPVFQAIVDLVGFWKGVLGE